MPEVAAAPAALHAASQPGANQDLRQGSAEATTDSRRRARVQVMCARWDDESYKARRCPPKEWSRRYGRHGVTRIWRDDVFPCRAYLRHCVLAASKLGEPAAANFLDATLLADRQTTVREHLERDPGIMEELPPPELVGRYSG